MAVHEKYMKASIKLGKRAECMTSPNPLVGAVVVKNGRMVGKGYHRIAGAPHAEVLAINQAGKHLRGAVLYVTLEPCDHYGRTPPCTDAIIKSGIRKVVAAMKDPNPINNGRGLRRLKKHGIKVITGVLKEEAVEINAPYIKFIKTKMPYVTVKAASSLDGKIATRTGESKWITGEDSRRYVRRLRGKVDAVMIGLNTIMKDDPLLMADRSSKKNPIRIIVDSHLTTPLNARIFSTIKSSPIIIATIKRYPKIKRYEEKGARVIVTRQKAGRIDLKDLFKKLAEREITHILVEGGGELIGNLVDERLVDRYLFFFAPKIMGGRDAITSVEGKGISKLRNALSLKIVKIRKFRDDILIEAEACPERSRGKN